MQSNFAQQWSVALGLNVSAIPADNAGVQRLGQGMADFLQMRSANSVMDKLNLELNALAHFGEDVRLKLDYGNGMVVNDETRRLADVFLVEAKEAVQGKWPQAWGDDLKEPLMMFVAYALASNALVKEDKIQWQKTLPILTASYVKEKGPEQLRAQINSIDQLLPQVLIGAASELLTPEKMPLFSEKIKNFTDTRLSAGDKPAPVEFLDILLEVRNAPEVAVTQSPSHP